MGEINQFPISTLEDSSDASDIMDAILSIPPSGSGGFSFEIPEGGFLLTNTWQVAQGALIWVENVPPVGMSLDKATGEFTVTEVARWMPVIERGYHNHDINPATPVVVHVKVQVDINDGNGFVDTDFERESFISAATANDEPAVLAFTTPFMFDVATAGTKFRLLFKADEDGADPEEVELVQLKVTANIIAKVPA